MYTTCLFCHADLGRNEVIEAFPVGRRLAYDAEKGRFWVVCRRCERWNLTPQEERWEAIEQAERLYGGTRLRASTDNVGLARLRDGTELVRIGRPLRPEFAAWRYGDQFGRRRTRHLLWAGGALAVGTVVVVAGPVMGLFSLGGLAQAPNFINLANHARRARKRLALGDGPQQAELSVSLIGADQVRIAPDPSAGFALVVPHQQKGRGSDFFGENWGGTAGEPVRLTGQQAVVAAARLLPHLNRGGGSASAVRDAVDMLDRAGGTERLFADVAGSARSHRGAFADWHQSRWKAGEALGGATLSGLTARARLALEMAAHEEQERRALEGELRDLERAWQQAEEIAAIADDLLLPDSVGARLDQLKASVRGRNIARAGAASSPSSESGGASSS